MPAEIEPDKLAAAFAKCIAAVKAEGTADRGAA
jgi:hypothetical protein